MTSRLTTATAWVPSTRLATAACSPPSATTRRWVSAVRCLSVCLRAFNKPCSRLFQGLNNNSSSSNNNNVNTLNNNGSSLGALSGALSLPPPGGGSRRPSLSPQNSLRGRVSWSGRSPTPSQGAGPAPTPCSPAAASPQAAMGPLSVHIPSEPDLPAAAAVAAGTSTSPPRSHMYVFVVGSISSEIWMRVFEPSFLVVFILLGV